MTFEEILLKNGIVDASVLAQCKKESETKGQSLDEVLLRHNISELKIINAKSEFFGIPVKNLEGVHISFDILRYIPEDSARHYGVAPLDFKDGVLEVGMLKPDDRVAREALQFLSSKLNLPFKIFLVKLSDFKTILQDYKSLGGEAEKVLGELESVLSDQFAEQKTVATSDSPKDQLFVEEAPTTKMVAVVLRHAVEGRASDIHIEPLAKKVRIRFRVDGVLYTSLLLPLNIHDALVARIKILTNMKLDEKRKPQDGRFEARIGKRHVDFRVSTFPTFFGEKVVVRILDTEGSLVTLDALGLTGHNLEAVNEALAKPYGLILLTGPTGSGKTTTLYAMLRLLDREKYNIVSLEDPIEYNIEGINQSQVKPEIDYTFANGLRSILRQDPDMIMVGEIRDKETAQLAIQAALTGHLVFSTLHTNNATGVIPRLIDMGVEPYLIPPTLILAIAQRLTRTLCLDSRKPSPVIGSVKQALEEGLKDMPEEIRKNIKIPKDIYQAMPSVTCPRGTSGRTGVFEVLKMTSDLERIILTEASETSIIKEARKQGMITMLEDGILKVIEGKISLDQLAEVT